MKKNPANSITSNAIRLEDLLQYRVHRLTSKMALLTSRQLLDGSGLLVSEWRLICNLVETRELNMMAISRKLCLDPGPTSRLLKSAEKKNLVTRKSDPRDGRASIFRLTSAARRIHGEIWPQAQMLGEEFLKQFTQEECEILNNLLDRAIDYADSRLDKPNNL